MKLSKLAFAAAIAWGIYAGSAQAQVGQPAAQPAAFDYYYYQAAVQPSPSDAPPVAGMKAPAQAPYQAPAAGACEAPEEAACEPWRLCCQKECGWNLYGWLNAGVMANFHNPIDHYNGPVTFADRDWGQFNQAYAVLERKVNTDGCGWDWGGRVDFLWGSDYVFTQATGLELTDDGNPHWNMRSDGFAREYGAAFPQAYLELGYNDLSLKLGHFYTVLGYEVVPATGNFFYTHAYTMQYGEPFTHSGALATYKWSDTTNFVAGVVNGWDHVDRQVDSGAGILGLTWTGDGGLTFAYNVIFSPNEPIFFGPNAGLVQTNRNCASLVIGYTFGCDDKWQYVFQNDVGWQHEANAFDAVPNDEVADSAEWYGVNQYLFYTVNECWKAGLRAEWFRDDDGARVTGLRNPSNSIFGDNFVGNFYEVSAGLNWTPSANLTVRPELRYDWVDQSLPAPVAGARPYDGQDRIDQWLAGFDVIYLW